MPSFSALFPTALSLCLSIGRLSCLVPQTRLRFFPLHSQPESARPLYPDTDILPPGAPDGIPGDPALQGFVVSDARRPVRPPVSHSIARLLAIKEYLFTAGTNKYKLEPMRRLVQIKENEGEKCIGVFSKMHIRGHGVLLYFVSQEESGSGMKQVSTVEVYPESVKSASITVRRRGGGYSFQVAMPELMEEERFLNIGVVREEQSGMRVERSQREERRSEMSRRAEEIVMGMMEKKRSGL